MKSQCRLGLRQILESPPSRGAWIEIHVAKPPILSYKSPPSRGAWIEIVLPLSALLCAYVAPLAGGVD